AKNPNCGYLWMDYITSPKAQAQVAEYFGEAPANTQACSLTSDKSFCDTYHAEDAAFAAQIHYWTTPIEQCLDGRTDVKCTDSGGGRWAWAEVKGCPCPSSTAARASGWACSSRRRCCGWEWPTWGPWGPSSSPRSGPRTTSRARSSGSGRPRTSGPSSPS